MSAVLVGKGRKAQMMYDPRVLAHLAKMYQAENLQKKPLFSGVPAGVQV